MKEFTFQYQSYGRSYSVTIKDENLNKALIQFATKYHEVDKIYEIINH